MSSSTEYLFNTLNTIQYRLYHYVLPLFIAFGTVGNLFNLIVFLQPYLRTNPCSIYLLAYTTVSICWVDFVALTASLTIGFSTDLGIQSPAACRIRTYIVYVTINLLPAFLIRGVTLFWLLFNIHTLMYTDIEQLPTGQSICIPLPGNFFNNFIFLYSLPLATDFCHR